MNTDKQKLLIGALAVVALAAGSYFIFRDSSKPVTATGDNEVAVARQRDIPVVDKSPVSDREPRQPRPASATPGRRDRLPQENRPHNPRPRNPRTGPDKVPAKRPPAG